MIIENNKSVLKLKPSDFNNIKLFFKNQLVKYPNKDVILVVDFEIDMKLINYLNKWKTLLGASGNILVVVSEIFFSAQIPNNELFIIPTIEEANDFIELENIKRDLENP